EGTILEANNAASQLLKTPARRLTGKPMVLFLANDDRLCFHGELSRLLQGELPREHTVRVIPRGENAAERVAVLGVNVQRDPATGRVRYCWQLRDITERGRAEQQVRVANEGLEQRVRERTAQLEAALREREALLESEHACRARAEEAERLLQAEARQKDDFLALLAHELRGPLAPLLYATRVLRGEANE